MRTLPPGDVLLVAGDFTSRGKVEELTEFNKFLGRFKPCFKEIVITPGNHDFLFEERYYEACGLITNATILLNEAHTLYNGMTIFGSPLVPPVWGAFNAGCTERLSVWDSIPTNVDILMTHSPAFGILDQLASFDHYGKSCGCELLLNRLSGLSQLKLHLVGHIHEAYGRIDCPSGLSHIAVNASICRRGIKEGLNSPIVVELPD